MITKVIDVSRWNGHVNYEKAKADGVTGVIIKAGGSNAGFYIDALFETNYQNAKKAGLNVGAYYFVGAKFLGETSGKADAHRFMAMLKGKQFELPVYLDIETTTVANKNEATNASIAFCDELEANGFYTGIYASDIYGFKERLELNRLTAYDKWVASYDYKPSYVKEYGMWQKSSTYTISGFHDTSGKYIDTVDLNECYIDYPTIIKNTGLNGFLKEVNEEVKGEKEEVEKVEQKSAYLITKVVTDPENYEGFRAIKLD